MTAAPPTLTLSPAQDTFAEAVFSGRYRYLGYGGAIRSGKSAVAIILAQTLARIYPGSRWAIVRKDLPTLRRNVLPTFSKFRIEGFATPVNQSTWLSKCSNGSELVFFTESIKDDPDLDRWKGLEVNGFILEEGNELQEVSWRKAIERAGSWIVPNIPEQPPPLIIVTCNPSAGWVKRVFYDPWANGSLEEPFYFQKATIADNPHLEPAYIESLKSLPQREYNRFVLGDWSTVTGAFFDELSADTHLVPPMGSEGNWTNLPQWWTYWGSYDWGFRHPAVAMAFAKDGDGTTYLLDTRRMHKMGDDAQASMIRNAFPAKCYETGLYSGLDTFSKRQAHTMAQESVQDVFGRYGIRTTPAHTARVQGWSVVRRGFSQPKKPDGSPDGRPRLLICDTPGNQWAIARLLELSPDPSNPDDLLKIDANDDGEGGDDAADCLRYGVASPPWVPRSPVPTAEPWTQGLDNKEWQTFVQVSAKHPEGMMDQDSPGGDGYDRQLPLNW